MVSMPVRLSFVVLVLGLSACAEPATSYGPIFDGYGYAEHRVDEDTWRVGFAGNGGTPGHLVEIYALYRAAEITLVRGRERFAVLDTTVEATRIPWRFALVPFYLQEERSFGYRNATGFPVSSLRPPATRTTAWATIRLLPGEVPPEAPVHDARQVIETYGPGI